MENFSADGGSPVCLDTLVHLESYENKVLSNLDMDPMDTLKLVETESTLWAEAQVLQDQRMTPQINMLLPSIPRR